MKNYSPLRYPGGKSTLYPIVANIIERNRVKDCTYIEPFAGGASIALGLLINDVVKRVIINDADRAVYSFWRAITESPNWFVEKIERTPVSVDEWYKQQKVVNSATKYSRELGFAMFYLNRTNRSGIISAGPIGGYRQNGDYKIDCRFNKRRLVEKIELIARYRSKIKIYNQDIFVFIKKYLPPQSVNQDIFIYFDPPYYEKGQRLYLNHFLHTDHERLKKEIAQIDYKWIMTYDDRTKIENLYSDYEKYRFSINYSLSTKKRGGELMIFKDKSCIPSPEVMNCLSKSISFNI